MIASYPCPYTFLGGIPPNAPFHPYHANGHLIGPIEDPCGVRLVDWNISGDSPILGVVMLYDGRRTTDIWHRDGSHRSGNPLWVLRNAPIGYQAKVRPREVLELERAMVPMHVSSVLRAG